MNMQATIYPRHSSVQYVEKYRPRTFEEMAGNDEIVEQFQSLARSPAGIPHLLLYGPAGTGKTTIVLCLIHHLHSTAAATAASEPAGAPATPTAAVGNTDGGGVSQSSVAQQPTVAPQDAVTRLVAESAVLFVNASGERQQKDVSGRVRTFCNAVSPVCQQRGIKKIVVLDEVDYMTEEAQNLLREVLDTYNHSVRFFMTCNNIIGVIKPVQSRCTIMSMTRLQHAQVRERLMRVVEAEQLRYTQEAIDYLATSCRGDMRRALNLLQAAASAPPHVVSTKRIRDVCCEPDPRDVERGLTYAWRGAYAESMAVFETLRRAGHSPTDILGMILSVLAVLDAQQQSTAALAAANPDDPRINPDVTMHDTYGAPSAHVLTPGGWNQWRLLWDVDTPDPRGRSVALLLSTIDLAGSFHLQCQQHIETPMSLWRFVSDVCELARTSRLRAEPSLWQQQPSPLTAQRT